MKKLRFMKALLLICLLMVGVGNAWGDSKSENWDLTSASSDWVATGNETYFSQPYGYKKANGTLVNKNIPDFSVEGISEIKVGFKCLQNGGSTSKLTIYLVDSNGNILGDGQVITPIDASSANATKYEHVTFTTNLDRAAGFMMKVTTFGKNILVNGANYEITYAGNGDGKITIDASKIDDFAGSYADRTWYNNGVSGKCYAYRVGAVGSYMMQFNNTPYVYNTNPIPGRIKSITITKGGSNDKKWRVYCGTAQMASANDGTQIGTEQLVNTSCTWETPNNSNYTYFYLTKETGATQITEIVVEYEAAVPEKKLVGIYVSGTPQKIEYIEGEVFDPEGLIVTGKFDDNSEEQITDEITWNVTPSLLMVGITSVSVKASVDGIVSPAYEVTGLTINSLTTLATIDQIFEVATNAGTTATDTRITFNNWVVSGVKNSNAYVTDGTKGFIIYNSNHGFEVGDVLSGTALCKVQLYKGSAELTNLTSATTGLAVTKGGTTEPQEMSIAELSGINTGAVLTFCNLIYNGTDFTDGTNTIKPYNTFMSLPTLTNGKKYNVKGVYIQYDTTKEIAPRTTGDIEEVEKQANTLEITVNSILDYSTYQSYNEMIWQQDGVSGKVKACYNSSTPDLMQFNESCYIYNTTPVPGYIRSIKLTYASGNERSWNVYVSPNQFAEVPTSGGLGEKMVSSSNNPVWNITGSNSYFYIKNISGYDKLSKIEISYEPIVPTNPTSLAWSTSSATVTKGADNNSFPTLTKEPEDLTPIRYSSSDSNVATIDVNTGNITLVGKGATIITASFAGNDAYSASSASYTLNVELIEYVITWNVNGNDVNSTTVGEGEKIPFSTPESSFDGYDFMGWTNMPIEGTQTSAPAVLFTSESKVLATGHLRYYAVYAEPVNIEEDGNSSSISKFADGTYYIVDTFDGQYYAMKGVPNSNGAISSENVSENIILNEDGSLSVSNLTNDDLKYSMTLLDGMYILKQGESKITLKAKGNSLSTHGDFEWTGFEEGTADKVGRFSLTTEGTNSSGNTTKNCLLFQGLSAGNITALFKGYNQSNRGLVTEKAQSYASGYMWFVPVHEDYTNYWTTKPFDDVYTNFAVRGDFPDNTTNDWELRNLNSIGVNKFSGVIDATSWANGAEFGFQFYNKEGDTENYWDNGGKYDFTTSNSYGLELAGHIGDMTWKHHDYYSSYLVEAEYIDSEWHVTITGIADTYYLPGSWFDPNWTGADDANLKFVNNTLTLNLQADFAYEFKVYNENGSTWYGSTDIIEYDTTGDPWVFHNTETANCHIKTIEAGEYIFTLSFRNWEPRIEVRYPDGKIKFAAVDEEYYWATISNAHNIVIPESSLVEGEEAVVTAYAVEAQNGKIILHSLEDCKKDNEWHLPANTGYLLKCAYDGVKPTVLYSHKKETDGVVNETNMLRPATQEKEGDGSFIFYMLSYGDTELTPSTLGFYWGADKGKPFKSRVGSAYLAVPASEASSLARGFAFSDTEETTSGITVLNINGNEGYIYNLNGQRVNTPVRGQIYIVNGHKFIAK